MIIHEICIWKNVVKRRRLVCTASESHDVKTLKEVERRREREGEGGDTRSQDHKQSATLTVQYPSLGLRRIYQISQICLQVILFHQR